MLDSSGIYRIVRDLCLSELTQSRRASNDPDSAVLDDIGAWSPGTVLLERHAVSGEHCLFLDSLERIAVASSINQFFRLHCWGVEDNLLRQKTLGELVDLVSTVLLDPNEPWQALTLLSSGTTGAPKRIDHSRQGLLAEVESWHQLIPGARRVLSLIPSHHLYGLVWTVLWPGLNSMEVLDCRRWSPGRWQQEMRPGDVIVAVPVQWNHLVRSLGSFAAGVTGITSAGRLSESLWASTSELGLSRMIEVYGSTETGGVATRESVRNAFQVAKHWALKTQLLPTSLPDDVEFEAEDRFRILGRKDGTVKIAGTLVSLAEVQKELLDCESVRDCRVRLSGTDEATRLEALIVSSVPAAEQPSFERELSRLLSAKLPAAAIPRRFQFADELPMNEMGKVVVW